MHIVIFYLARYWWVFGILFAGSGLLRLALAKVHVQ